MACHAGNTNSRREEGPLAKRFQSTEKRIGLDCVLGRQQHYQAG